MGVMFSNPVPVGPRPKDFSSQGLSCLCLLITDRSTSLLFATSSLLEKKSRATIVSELFEIGSDNSFSIKYLFFGAIVEVLESSKMPYI